MSREGLLKVQVCSKWLLLIILLLLIDLLLTFWARSPLTKRNPSPNFQITMRDQAVVKSGLIQALTFLILVTLNKRFVTLSCSLPI